MVASYYVVKYVKDLVRDEPVNVGIIVQSKEKIVHRLITSEDSLRRSLLNRLSLDLASLSLDEVFWKHGNAAQGSHIRFTEARATLATDLHFELEELLKRLVY